MPGHTNGASFPCLPPPPPFFSCGEVGNPCNAARGGGGLHPYTRGKLAPQMGETAAMGAFVVGCLCCIESVVGLVLSEYKKPVVFYYKKRVFYYRKTKKTKIKKNPKSCFFIYFLFFYIFLCTKHCYVLFFIFVMINYMKTTLNCPSHTLCYCWFGE